MFKVSELWTGAVGRIAVVSVVCFLQAAVAGAGQLIISEFRLRGPTGATDEFIEIYNNTDAPHTVSGVGYRLRHRRLRRRSAVRHPERNDPPGARTLPLRQLRHATRSAATRPATGRPRPAMRPTQPTFPTTPASRSSTRRSRGASSLANRLDAVGSTAEVNTLYKEGVGLSGADALQHRLLLHAQGPWRVHRRRGWELQQRVAGADDGRPEHDAVAGHRRQRHRLHPLRGHQRHQCRRRPAAGSARTAEPELADFPRRICAGGIQARRRASAATSRQTWSATSPPTLATTRRSAPSTSVTPSPTTRAATSRGCGSASWTSRRSLPPPESPTCGHARRPTSSCPSIGRRAARRSRTVLVQWNDPGTAPFAAQRFGFQRFAVGRYGHARDAAGGRRLRGRALPARHPADGRRSFLCRPRDAARIELAGVLFHRLD